MMWSASGTNRSGNRQESREYQPPVRVGEGVWLRGGSSNRVGIGLAHPPTIEESGIPQPTEKNNVVYTDGSGGSLRGYAVVITTVQGDVYTAYGRLPIFSELLRILAGEDPPPVSNDSKVKRLSAQAAELYAIYIALRLTTGPLVICSDSEYAINVYTVYAKKWSKNGWTTKKGVVAHLELVQATYQLICERRIQFLHVRSHTGVKYNEMADKLAGSGATCNHAIRVERNGQLMRQC